MIALPLGRPQRYTVVASPDWVAAHGAPQTPADPPLKDCLRVRLPNGALFRIAAERLVRLLADWTPPRPGFSLYYPGRRNPSAGFAAFLAVVREAAARDATISR